MKKKVILISTGGTIASKRNLETGLLTAGVLTGEELSDMCELPAYIDCEVVSIFQIPSNHMTFKHLTLLKAKIEEIFKDKKVDGIVVTHGTDTLEETAYFLDLVIADERPVVVTGSQRGPSAMGTDAFVNLRQAILAASHENCQYMGTVVLFNERIFSARYVKKKHASNVDGFTSFGYGYLGTVDQNNILIYQKPINHETYNPISDLPSVELVKFSLGSDGKYMSFAADQGTRGIIIEAAGRGHVPPGAMEGIKYAIFKGVTIILTTSANEGDVKKVYDFTGSAYDLENAGVILGKDYDSKKARIKLAVLMAAGITGIDNGYFN